MPANLSVAVEWEPCHEEHCEWVLFACLWRVLGNSLKETKIPTMKIDTPVPSVRAKLQTFRMSHKGFGDFLQTILVICLTEIIQKPQMFLIIQNNTFQQSEVITENGILMMEISTPHLKTFLTFYEKRILLLSISNIHAVLNVLGALHTLSNQIHFL